MLSKERSRQQDKYRQTCTARHKGINQNRNQTTATTLDSTCCHNSRHVTAKTHHKRDKRLAVQTRHMHQFIHNKCCTSHISRILHQRDKQIENQDIRQEHRNRTYTANDTINDKVSKRSVAHQTTNRLAKPRKSSLNPLLRICTQSKGTPEHNKHNKQEERNTKIFVRHDAVDKRCIAVIISATRRICLCQSTLDKTILFVGHGTLHIFAQSRLDTSNSSISLRLPLREMLSLRQQLLNTIISLKHLS